ncbi:MAG: excinuclease ABC subunit UvrC, partial [Firmicutes bacterium]|nr:excinuclease ABC subunit UvrC [Bacillota bacterium]
MDLKTRPMLFKYMGTVQEEVHRFSIDYHRGLRDKGKLTSVLDEVEGIGPVKRNALLAYFGSIEKMKKA